MGIKILTKLAEYWEILERLLLQESLKIKKKIKYSFEVFNYSII